MRINTINDNVNFAKLHIKANATNKAAIEKLLEKDANTLTETLSDLDRESGNSNIYMYTGSVDSNIDIVITDGKMNILAARRVGIGDKNQLEKGLERLVNAYVTYTCKEKPPTPAKNEKVEEILNQYA